MQIEPLHFGSEGRQLFGCYHVPAGELKNTGIVVCPPLFTEYYRAHGSLKRLADRLSQCGFHVLRFDYFGTGDSEGTSEAISIAGAMKDIDQAIAELRSLSGARQVILLGARLGADFALRVSPDNENVSKILLWDPILDGTAYLKELRQRHEELIRSHTNIGDNERKTVGWGREILGFKVSPSLVSQIESIDEQDFAEIASQTSCPMSCITTSNSREIRLHADAADQGENHTGREVEIVRVAFDCEWFNFWDGEFFPHRVIDEIVKRV